jgi:hypothetical protein
MSAISTILNFEGHTVTFLEDQASRLLVRANDLMGPMEVTQQAISKKVQQLAEEDKVQLEVVGSTGPKLATFLTESGALQVMATGRSEKCRRLRKVVCDFFVQNRHRQEPSGSLTELAAALIYVGNGMADMARALTSCGAASKPKAQSGKATYPIWTHEEALRLESEGFMEAADFLRSIGADCSKQKASGMTMRTLKACEAQEWPYHRLFRQSRLRTYLPRHALQLVYDAGQLFTKS